MKKNISNLIKHRRGTLGLTQAKVSKSSGLHIQYVSNIERGLCGLPPELVQVLSRVLKVQPIALINAATKDYRDTYKKKAGVK